MGYLSLALLLVYAVSLCLTWGRISSGLHRAFAILVIFGGLVLCTFFIQVMAITSISKELQAYVALGFIAVLIGGCALVLWHLKEAVNTMRIQPQSTTVVYKLPKTKECEYCHVYIPDDAAFCCYCGARLESTSAGRVTTRI